MRKLSSIAFVLGTLLIAGCGGGGGGDASSPLDNALGYLPSDAPFAVAISTDTKGDQYGSAGDAIGRFSGAEGITQILRGMLEQRTGDIKQLEKALGNPFVVGSTDAKTFIDAPDGEDRSFVGAIQATSQDALNEILDEEKAEEAGDSNGATLYKDDSGDTFAVEGGDTLVVAGSQQELEAALATRDGAEHLTEDDFDAATKGISQSALLRVYLDIGGLLRASPDAATALKIKWIDALRTGGLGLTFDDGEVAIDLNVNTDPDGLTDADLPIASGSESPQIVDRGGQISIALRDPSQIIDFAQAAAKSADPEGFSSFEAGKAQIERRLKIDLENDLIAQLEGDMTVNVGLDGKFGARAELRDPAKFEKTLAKVGDVLPDIAEGIAGEKVGFAEPKAGEDFYALATSTGTQVVFGVVDGVFVVANDPAIAGAVAAAKPETVAGSKGSVVVNTDAERLAKTLLEQIDNQDFDFTKIAGAVGTRPLDQLGGSFEATTAGLSGGLKLSLDKER